MIKISVNDQCIDIKKDTPLNELIRQLDYRQNKFAVAINGEFVPKHQYAQTRLNDQDQVDIVTAVQGG